MVCLISGASLLQRSCCQPVVCPGCAFNSTVCLFFSTVTVLPMFHAVFYEELVERPEAVAAQLLSACGLPWEPGVLNFQDTDRSVQTASMEQVGVQRV